MTRSKAKKTNLKHTELKKKKSKRRLPVNQKPKPTTQTDKATQTDIKNLYSNLDNPASYSTLGI